MKKSKKEYKNISGKPEAPSRSDEPQFKIDVKFYPGRRLYIAGGTLSFISGAIAGAIAAYTARNLMGVVMSKEFSDFFGIFGDLNLFNSAYAAGSEEVIAKIITGDADLRPMIAAIVYLGACITAIFVGGVFLFSRDDDRKKSALNVLGYLGSFVAGTGIK